MKASFESLPAGEKVRIQSFGRHMRMALLPARLMSRPSGWREKGAERLKKYQERQQALRLVLTGLAAIHSETQ